MRDEFLRLAVEFGRGTRLVARNEEIAELAQRGRHTDMRCIQRLSHAIQNIAMQCFNVVQFVLSLEHLGQPGEVCPVRFAAHASFLFVFPIRQSFAEKLLRVAETFLRNEIPGELLDRPRHVTISVKRSPANVQRLAECGLGLRKFVFLLQHTA